MKIIEAINRIDSLKHNTYTQNEKVEWLSELDWDVAKSVIATHEGDDDNFTGYNDSADLQTELLIPAPYDKAYLLWMEAQIHYYNSEYDKYNNAMDMFNEAYDGFKRYYNRTHMPKCKKIKYFGEPATKEYVSANSVAKIGIEEA